MKLEIFIGAKDIVAKIKDVEQKLFDLEDMKTALKGEFETDRIEGTFCIFLTGSKTTFHLKTHTSAHDKEVITDLIGDEIEYYQGLKKALEHDFANL